jgi:DNA invertase Pin-like site-specific DNA recombinase
MFMLHLYAALAEKERRLISERTKAALAVRKESGSKLAMPNRQLLWSRRNGAIDSSWLSAELPQRL